MDFADLGAPRTSSPKCAGLDQNGHGRRARPAALAAWHVSRQDGGLADLHRAGTAKEVASGLNQPGGSRGGRGDASG